MRAQAKLVASPGRIVLTSAFVSLVAAAQAAVVGAQLG